MLDRLLISFVSFAALFSGNAVAQQKAVMPFTGIKYFSEGVSAKSIEVKIDGAVLTSNRIPVNKAFEIRVVAPAGFAEDRKTVFAGAELNIANMKGEIIGKNPNVFKDNEAKGFPAAGFKDMVVKLMLTPDQVKADPMCTIRLRFYDLKGKNQLRVEFPVFIARPGEPLQLSKMVNDLKSTAGSIAMGTVLKTKSIDVTVDTTIRVNPKLAYISLDMKDIEGSSLSEMLAGKESYWVYDGNDLSEVKMADRQLKQVQGSMESNAVNYLSKVPYRPKALANKSYIVRFRWESLDKKKVIEVVVVK